MGKQNIAFPELVGPGVDPGSFFDSNVVEVDEVYFVISFDARYIQVSEMPDNCVDISPTRRVAKAYLGNVGVLLEQALKGIQLAVEVGEKEPWQTQELSAARAVRPNPNVINKAAQPESRRYT